MRITFEIDGWPGDVLWARFDRWRRKRVCGRRGFHSWKEPDPVALLSFLWPRGRYCSCCYVLEPDDERNGPVRIEFDHGQPMEYPS